MHRSTLNWKKILAGVLLLLGIAALFLFWPVREDLSPLKDLASQYNVTILRDTYGVPHIFGHTDKDAAYGLAYAHSEDDFITIQQVLLAARGQLGSVYGKDSAPADYLVQFLRVWDVVDNQYQHLSPETRALVEGYADGLNVYAAYHPDEALPGLFPVNGKDIVAASVEKSPLFFDLDKTLAHLFSDDPEPVPTSTGIPNNSNEFAIGPAHTSDGGTYLDVNSHQPYTGPVAWYEAHVHSDEGWDMVGGTFPASPLIIHGHNRDLGWAFTVNHPDLIDVYRLTINPQNPNQYQYDERDGLAGVTDVVMEVSSHAIDLSRIKGCEFDVAAFTNLTQDHLDYHGTIENYWHCKQRLFTEYLPEWNFSLPSTAISRDIWIRSITCMPASMATGSLSL